MKKVIDVNPDLEILTIGDDVSGAMQDYKFADCNFRPYIGDVVSIYTDSETGKVLIVKEEKESDLHHIDRSFAEESSHQTYVNEDNAVVVNKFAYGIIAILVGTFGVHHFYAGRTSKGVLFIILTVLLGWLVIPVLYTLISSIIDGIKVLSMTADANGNVRLSK